MITERQEKLHAAMLRAATWHLFGKAPDEDVAAAWEIIAGAELAEMVEAARAVLEAPDQERVDEDGRRWTTVRTTIHDRLVAALYLAARYEPDPRCIVARPDPGRMNRARAVYVLDTRIAGDDDDGGEFDDEPACEEVADAA